MKLTSRDGIPLSPYHFADLVGHTAMERPTYVESQRNPVCFEELRYQIIVKSWDFAGTTLVS